MGFIEGFSMQRNVNYLKCKAKNKLFFHTPIIVKINVGKGL